MAKGELRQTSSYTSSYNQSKETPGMHYAIVLLAVISLIVSTATLVYVYKIKTAVVPQTVNLEDFLKKLTSHQEMKAYVGVAPLNIIQINNNNFANLQQQISGLDVSFIGSFILQYTDRIVVYDYAKDQVRGNAPLQQQQAALPADFTTKFYNHPETNGLQNEQPVGGTQLNEAGLTTLKQQFPDVYANAKVGDFVFQYKTRLIIYDYNQDKIVNAVQLA